MVTNLFGWKRSSKWIFFDRGVLGLKTIKRVTILGAGPVGLATGVLLRRLGHEVVCIDTNADRIRACQEKQFGPLQSLSQELDLQFECSYQREFINETIFFCVGTPFTDSLNSLSPTQSAIESLLRTEATGHIQHICFRSTFKPGTCEDLLIPLIKKSWKRNDLAVSYFPEFLREKFVREDLERPPLSLVAHSGIEAEQSFSSLGISHSVASSMRLLELLKLSCNAFHALKVSFANEIAVLAQNQNLDAEELMDLFCQDEKLNISKMYLRPGAPFGGACLDKDLRALEQMTEDGALPLSLIPGIRPSNELRKKNSL